MTRQHGERDPGGGEERKGWSARVEEDEGDEAEEEEEEEGDCFFESLDRVPSGISVDFDVASFSSDSEDDVRVSFASAIAPPSDFRRGAAASTDEDDDEDEDRCCYDYGVWMAEPMSVTERRRLLLKGMGLASSKDLSVRAGLRPSSVSRGFSLSLAAAAGTGTTKDGPRPSPPPPQRFPPPLITRSRSETQLPSWAAPATQATLTRASSAPPALGTSVEGGFAADGGRAADGSLVAPGGGGLFTIKNLDTGKEFVVSEVGQDGTLGRLNDLQTGLQLTLEEFETFLGYSPIVKELMRRVNLGGGGGADRRMSGSGGASLQAKSTKAGGRKKKGGWLRNIKVAASSVTGLITEKDQKESGRGTGPGPAPALSSSSEWMKVRQHGKSYKELTGLYMCQEIQAHQGSIWSIKFSPDSRYLASAGEDRVVHVWQVLECNAFTSSSLQRQDTRSHLSTTTTTTDGRGRPPRVASLQPSKRTRTRKGKASLGSCRRPLPDYIVIPETIFSLSDKPVCSFQGHLDDVLDLSWSRSQNLLSSSMDKTVRLWDMESKACLKLFAHNDYVTCIQFNPIDDRYFISGSLDAKVRIWSIPDRQVVDWSDLHEMVTAACYTPDGQGALVGSHKGSCRFYKTSDSKLYQEGQIDIRNKRKKSHAKKITGFQFAPGNSDEVLITAADSQIRVFDGVNMIHKYKGFRNTSSQISASFTSDGKYVVCASEDSHVYIWKRDVVGCHSGAGGKGKGWITTQSHEHFHCQDVSVAIPWPSYGSNCEPSSLPSWTWRHNIYSEQRIACSDSLRCSSTLEDVFQSSRSHCPPSLPKKSCSGHQVNSPEKLHHQSRSGSGVGSSSSFSASPSMQSRSLSSNTASTTSSSSLLSWGWYGGSSSRASCVGTEDASAWGLVVVTAGLGGSIRVYQNFGLPLGLGRQTTLF